MEPRSFIPPRPARASDFPIHALPANRPDPQLLELRYLIGSIRQNLDAAAIDVFHDIPELARAAVLCRVAERVAGRETFERLADLERLAGSAC